MARAMESAFEQIGITKIKSVGEILNPALHNAIQVVTAADGVVPNTVVEEMQAGYMFGDNVLRTAMVVVAK
jgi:molecular chaperone GrpE